MNEPENMLETKNGILEEEFCIEMEGDRKELMRNMCNLSQGIKEQGIEEGILLGTEQNSAGLEKGKDSSFSSAQGHVSRRHCRYCERQHTDGSGMAVRSGSGKINPIARIHLYTQTEMAAESHILLWALKYNPKPPKTAREKSWMI